jgi:hypothetical protein
MKHKNYIKPVGATIGRPLYDKKLLLFQGGRPMVAPTDEIIIAVLVFYGTKGSIKFIDHSYSSALTKPRKKRKAFAFRFG